MFRAIGWMACGPGSWAKRTGCAMRFRLLSRMVPACVVARIWAGPDLRSDRRIAGSGRRLLQRLEGFSNIGVEAGAARIEMRENLFAHPGIPEFPDVIGNARNGLVVALALEELADLVGHVDQAVRRRRHGRPL